MRGLMNMQYAIEDDTISMLEANPRASRTVPLVSKVLGDQMVPLAKKIMTLPMTGAESPLVGLKHHKVKHCGVKEAVFPFNMFPEVDPLLRPEMRSTGEVLGLADSFGLAFYRAQEAAKTKIPLSGAVFISVSDRDKAEVGKGVCRTGLPDCGNGRHSKPASSTRNRLRADEKAVRGLAECAR